MRVMSYRECRAPSLHRPKTTDVFVLRRADSNRYVVVVKVGKPTETSKPGNRGKRDSQVLLLQYLNRVHFDAAMCPLELEIYHQMRNVIGIDPTFYEYIFQVDADTVGSLSNRQGTICLCDSDCHARLAQSVDILCF